MIRRVISLQSLPRKTLLLKNLKNRRTSFWKKSAKTSEVPARKITLALTSSQVRQGPWQSIVSSQVAKRVVVAPSDKIVWLSSPTTTSLKSTPISSSLGDRSRIESRTRWCSLLWKLKTQQQIRVISISNFKKMVTSLAQKTQLRKLYLTWKVCLTPRSQ